MTMIGVLGGYFSRNLVLNYTIPTLDELFDVIFVKTTLSLARLCQWLDSEVIDGLVNLTANMQVSLSHMVAWLDKNIVDGFVHLLTYLSGILGKATRSLQGGKVQLYFVWALLGLLSLVFYVIKNS